jgi:hypothetical protein
MIQTTPLETGIPTRAVTECPTHQITEVKLPPPVNTPNMQRPSITIFGRNPLTTEVDAQKIVDFNLAVALGNDKPDGSMSRQAFVARLFPSGLVEIENFDRSPMGWRKTTPGASWHSIEPNQKFYIEAGSDLRNIQLSLRGWQIHTQALEAMPNGTLQLRSVQVIPPNLAKD